MTKIEQDLKKSWTLCPLIITHLKKEVGLLRVCIGQTTDIDIKSYPLKVIDKLTTMLTTLWNVINIDKDFYVANVVIRSIADNVALLFLIYDKDEGEIRILRHYLFLLDGIRSRLANIIMPIKNDDVTEDEYQKLIKQQEDFKSMLNDCKKNIIECITSLKSYYEASKEFLTEDVSREIFKSDRKIFTKDKSQAPTMYGENAEVKGSFIATGCQIDGTVEDSTLFRKVKIGKGSTIRDSVIMQSCKIGENVVLENVILDKNVVISDNKELKGDKDYPMVIEKNETV